MKLNLNLVRILRRLFGFMRWLVAIGASCGIALVLVILLGLYHPKTLYAQADVSLTGDSALPHVHSMGTAGNDIALSNVQAKLCINLLSQDPEFSTIVRWQIVCLGMLGFVFLFLWNDLLWRLCRNVERGEVFSEANARHVRNLGVITLVYVVGGWATGLWFAWAMRDFLAHRIAAEGITLSLRWWTSSDLALLVTGLLLLALGEVFRQGLALKKENELTV
jgi:hypothetical protein